MKVRFGVKDSLEVEEYIVLTHPEKKYEWKSIKNTLLNLEETINVMDTKTENNIVLKLSEVMSVQSEERRCNIITKNGDMFLLNMRLKNFEEKFINKNMMRINNSVIININYIERFQTMKNSRMEVVLGKGMSYFVSRYYIKNFKERLL